MLPLQAARDVPTTPTLRTGIPGLVWAYRFAADGSALALPSPVDRELLDTVAADGGWLWLHFSLSDMRGCEFIAQMPLPARAQAALLSADEHPNLHLEGDTAFGVFVDWHFEAQAGGAPCDARIEADTLGPLRFALTEGLIVSARLHPLRSVETVRRRIEDGTRIDSAGRILEAIVEQFAASVTQANAGMSDALDRIEDRVLAEAPSDERRDLGLLRRQAVRLHRPLTALRRVLQQFERRHREHSSHALLASAARLSQRVDDLDADVVTIEKRARLLQDEVAAKLSEQTNRHLYALSIMTSLFLPPTLIVGVFGMNTGGLPLTQDPAGFAVAMALCVAASGVVWRLLRRLGVTR